MKRSTKIVTPKDVFDHFGAGWRPELSLEDNNRSLSHRIYKDTECGAWAKVVETTLGKKRPVMWHADLGLGLGGIHFRRAWTARVKKAILDHSQLPPEVHQFLGLDERGLVMIGDARPEAWLSSLQPDKSIGFMKISRNFGPGLMRSVTIKVPMFSSTGKGYQFLCGSIVEGVDAGVEPDPVPLPTTGKKLDKAVADVESAAHDIWMDTHGCDKCNDDGQYGGSINPDCPKCKGHGVAL